VPVQGGVYLGGGVVETFGGCVGWWTVRSRATRIIGAEGEEVWSVTSVKGGSLQERFMRDQGASDRLIQSSSSLLILGRSAPGTSFSEFM
jgi:hypothetical protein